MVWSCVRSTRLAIKIWEGPISVTGTTRYAAVFDHVFGLRVRIRTFHQKHKKVFFIRQNFELKYARHCAIGLKFGILESFQRVVLNKSNFLSYPWELMPTRPATKFKIRSLTASTSDIFYSFFLQKYIRLLFKKRTILSKILVLRIAQKTQRNVKFTFFVVLSDLFKFWNGTEVWRMGFGMTWTL